MNKFQSKQFSKSTPLTKNQVMEILTTARKEFKNWEKSSPINPLFSYGSVFNDMIKWLEPYKEDEIVSCFIVARIMQCFSKYSKFETPKKKKYTGQVVHSEPVDINFKFIIKTSNK